MDGVKGPVVLFDGVCNLCNESVRFIVDRDPGGAFRFAPLGSEVAAKLLSDRGDTRDPRLIGSVILVEDDRIYERSDAALRIARRLSFPASLAYAFIVVPRFLRDGVYGVIARNRYRWFGKTTQCRVPTPELRARFLT